MSAKRLSLILSHLTDSEQLTVTFEQLSVDSSTTTPPPSASTSTTFLPRSDVKSTIASHNSVNLPSNIIVRIGSVSVPLATPHDSTLVPSGYLFPDQSDSLTTQQQLGRLSKRQDLLSALQFLMKKQLLKQDIFLIGPPGPTRRRLALAYCELMRREVEYLCVSPDVTESDIKQRREIKNKSAVYEDAAAVRAALLGRVLIIDGIEKAERNVLPVINNLLENREMALEDGRFIVSPDRYEELLERHGVEQIQQWNLIRAHPDFFVIAIGLPVPPYYGNPLDPPLRSRFQARTEGIPRVGSQVCPLLLLSFLLFLLFLFLLLLLLLTMTPLIAHLSPSPRLLSPLFLFSSVSSFPLVLLHCSPSSAR